MSSAALVAVVAAWLLAPAVITAQSLQQAGASIAGQVIDGASGLGLSDARVQIQLAARDASQPPAVSPGAVLTGLGSTRVNSSIGAQWPTRIASIQSTLLNHLSVGWSYPVSAPRCGPLTSDADRERVRMRVVLGPVQ